MDQVKDFVNQNHPFVIKYITEGYNSGYYYAYLTDFGESSISATGKTIQEALQLLKDIKREVIQYYLEKGKEIPEPTKIDYHYDLDYKLSIGLNLHGVMGETQIINLEKLETPKDGFERVILVYDTDRLIRCKCCGICFWVNESTEESSCNLSCPNPWCKQHRDQKGDKDVR